MAQNKIIFNYRGCDEYC